jgi:thymidine kinase
MNIIQTNMENKTIYDFGYLEIVIGPMFSGKTSKILDIYKQCKFCNIDVMVINHSLDTRYDNVMLSTHDKNMIPCHQMDKLSKLFNNNNSDQDKNQEQIIIYNKAKVVLINEAQFFPDLEEYVKIMIQHKKNVYISGLDGDFQQKKFGQILDLIPLCDKITKFTSLCALCKDGTPAIFSKRLSNEREQMIIGSDNYIPVCRYCYNQ